MLNIDRKINYWKNKLLDLSQRNKLINFPAQKQLNRLSRTSIPIYSPDAATLWTQIVENNTPFSFPAEYPSETLHIYDNKEAEKTLRSLKTRAKIFIEEKGFNPLHFALGFINWQDKSGSCLRSPLLLVSGKLTQKDILSPYVFSRNDQEIVHNYALALKLKNEYNIDLPIFSYENNFFEYLDKVQKNCSAIKCNISLDVELSLFSFFKINIHQDLIKNAEKIKFHPIIRAISGDAKFIERNQTKICQINHDAIAPQNVFNVLDADSSQQDAILMAKSGVSFVIQGPPGTGKSQTIVNITANLLSDGKKVLFSSEKLAALDIVHKRLISSGLGGFCLAINNETKRRDIINQIEETMKLTKNKTPLLNNVSLNLSKLAQQRAFLNSYVNELHSIVNPIGESIYCINGKLASLHSAPDIHFSFKNPEKLSQHDLSKNVELLKDVSRIVAKSGYQYDNPWSGCRLKNISNQFRQQFSIEADNAINAIDSVIISLNNHGIYNSETLCYYDYENCFKLVELQNRIKEEYSNIESKYTKNVFLINTDDYFKRCFKYYRYFFRIIFLKYWADRKYVINSQIIIDRIKFADMYKLAERLKNIRCMEDEVKRLTELINKRHEIPVEIVANLYSQLSEPIKWFTELFEEEYYIFSKPLDELRKRIVNCIENISNLEDYVDYRNLLQKSSEHGIEDFIIRVSQASLPEDTIIPAFEKCFYSNILDSILPKYNSVNNFRRQKHEDNIKLFKELDLSHLDISRAELINKLLSNIPAFDSPGTEHDQMTILKREIFKQRKTIPIRKLFTLLQNILPLLKPCMIMSPLSVSTYLGDANYEFDTVIFDEASQIRTEDAVCAIFRAKQVIITGDSKQLPPTDFFNISTSVYDNNFDEEKINDEGAFESLLDEASLLPSQTLLWHYRSRHEDLISFSNTNLYQGKLVTFPSPVCKSEDIGVQYIHVPNGVYDRGGRNGNIAEAEKVAELVYEHLYKNPNRSLGIIAFSEVQQTAIADALYEKRKNNHFFEQYFDEDIEESIFVKNLETVQGDERDTIIFSIGYAPDIDGKFIMNFGPLCRNGGERRLNVAITRARYNVKLVGSIKPSDVDLSRTNSEGAKLLRDYIEFAINGAENSDHQIDSNESVTETSLFENVIYDFLIAHGYNVEVNVGCSEYKIDMAISHPLNHYKFVIGIECDGSIYNSARTARDRDRLRHDVLETMGWKLYRVWSTDWIKDPKNEGLKLLSAIDNAIKTDKEIRNIEPANIFSLSNYLKAS